MGLFGNLFSKKPGPTHVHRILGTMTALRRNGDRTPWQGEWTSPSGPVSVYLSGNEEQPSAALLAAFDSVAEGWAATLSVAKAELLDTLRNADPESTMGTIDRDFRLTAISFGSDDHRSVELTFEQQLDPFHHFRVTLIDNQPHDVAVDS